jgi:capsular polysaccharide transport system permease protein
MAANQLLDRARQDAIDRAAAEVRTAKVWLNDRETALERFRNARMQIDPMDVARSLGETLAKRRHDLIRVEVKLNAAKASLAADAPQINMLAANRQALVNQIADLESRITSTNLNSPTASAALAGYDRLEVEKSLAEQSVVLAERQLDSAQADARRHHIYFITIQDPTRPQIALAPPRLWQVFNISIGSLSLWVLAALIRANVRDHTQ